MYTRCPECETTFRVSAEDLRRAQGKVRCGDCDHVFNAVEYLTEDPAETGEDIPVLDNESELESADNVLEPANETGIHEIPGAGTPEDYELEIKAYEKTGKAVSALDHNQPDDDPSTDESPMHIDLDGELPDDVDDDVAFETVGESRTVEMKTPLDTHHLDTVEMPLPEDLRKDGPATDEDADETDTHEIDDSVWEQIPGVGTTNAGQDIGIDVAGSDDEYLDDDLPDTGEPTMEFDVPVDKWSSFFGAAPKPPAPELPEDSEATDDDDAPHIAMPDGSAEDPEDAERLLQEMQVVFDETGESLQDEEDDAADDSDEDFPDWKDLEPIEEVVMATDEFGAAEISSSLDDDDDDESPTSRNKTHADEDWQPEDWQPDEEADAAEGTWYPFQRTGASVPISTKAMLIGGIVIVLLIAGFVGQLLHYQRDNLAAHPAWGTTVRMLYGRLGMELYPTWPTSDYEIRGSEAVAGESGQDVLDIRGQIAAISKTEVGMPLLRVVLRDRWSNPVAAKVFTPQEYALPGALQANSLPALALMMQPNQTIDAHVAIVDPGSGAQGFELEVCLPRRDTGLDCAGQGFE